MRLTLALITTILFTTTTTALAASPVWEVKKDNSIAYLGGTCHLLRDSDYPLPAAFDLAYGQASTIVLETDIGELNSPEIQKKMMAALFYSDGRTLQDALSPKAWQALVRYCEKTGVPIGALQPMKPPMVALTLLALELQKIGVTRTGVDQFFYDKAQADGKRIAGLETAEEQIGFLAAMGKGMEDELIEQSLSELRQTGTIFNKILDAWRQGDEKELIGLLIEDIRKNYPEIYQTLIAGRNRKWLPEIERLLATPEKELVLMGAAHLVGPDGIIEGLKKRGYQVKQLD
jgi:hypothetical protein